MRANGHGRSVFRPSPRQARCAASVTRRLGLPSVVAVALWLLVCPPPTLAQLGLLGASARDDVAQGAEVAKLVERSIGLVTGTETEAYLRDLGARLAAAADDARWQFRFQIVDQAEPNAFAIPGGGIYVSRGLLALVNREDELAGVLGHEIAHVTQRHSARQQRKGFLPGLLALPGNLVGNVVSENLGALINAPIETVGGAWLSRYSRGQETESDRIGIRTAAQAGYDPSALADILLGIDKEVATRTGQARRFSMFDSHPMTDTRLDDIRRRATELKPAAKPPLAPDTAALLAKIDGLWWGDSPESGVFRQDQFLQPAIGFTLTFPAGWSHQNTPQYVISTHPKKDAMLLLGVADEVADPRALGQRFIERMRTKARVEPVSTREAAIGEYPAFVVTYADGSGREPVHLHFAWVTMAGRSYQLSGLAAERHRETLRNAALTLRPLTSVGRDAVTGRRIRIVAAQAGERLETLSARSGNVWTLSYTALVNRLDPETPLSPGRLVKIAREERWTAPQGAASPRPKP